MEEAQLREFIANNPKVVVKAYMDENKCKYCKAYAPIFDKVASERKDYAFTDFFVNGKSDFGMEFFPDGRVPKTLIFENGTLKTIASGSLTEEQLNQLLNTGVAPQQQAPDPVIWAVNAGYDQLKKEVTDIEAKMKQMRHGFIVFTEELARRDRLKKRVEKAEKLAECKAGFSFKGFFTKEAWLNPCPFCKKVRIALGAGVLAGVAICLI